MVAAAFIARFFLATVRRANPTGARVSIAATAPVAQSPQ
jgi:hypothetical protein